MVCTILSDPLRKIAGLHRIRLNSLLTDLEKELLVYSQKELKKTLKSPGIEVYGEKRV
jgi:hypothetical protein